MADKLHLCDKHYREVYDIMKDKDFTREAKASAKLGQYAIRSNSRHNSRFGLTRTKLADTNLNQFCVDVMKKRIDDKLAKKMEE